MKTDIRYGTKYAATKDLRITEIAKLIRADIKAGVTAGTLPKAKYSVVSDSYSGGYSIRIRISGAEGIPTYNADRLVFEHLSPHVYCGLNVYSEEMRDVLKELNRIHGSYNFDGSDLMTDYHHVRFYGDASVDEGPEVRAKALAAALAPKAEPTPAQNDFLAYLGAV
jgi:hypothetical protein